MDTADEAYPSAVESSGMNAGTLLLRQVHPSFVQRGRITSQVFTPRLTDGNRLSVYDGDQISAESAWRHYTERQGRMSAGVVAVTVEECDGEGLEVHSDPSDFPEHAVIEFGEKDKGQIRAVAKRLRLAAEQRSWRYQSEAPSYNR